MYQALNRTLRENLTHPTLIHPLTGRPLTAVGYRRDGSPIWPVLGGAPDDGSLGDGGGDGGTGGNGGTGGDGGQPKLLDQATVDKLIETRLARERAKFSDYEQLKQKAAEHDKHVDATRTEHEKAIEAAKAEAATRAKSELLGSIGAQLVTAHIRAEVAGRLPREQLDVLLEHLATGGFLKDGVVDPDKVKAYVDGIVPTKRPPNLDQGRRNGGDNNDGKTSVAAGRDLWAERHPTKKTS